MDSAGSLQRLLFAQESALLRAEVRHSPEELETLLAEEFLEFGSSGQQFDRAAIIEELATEDTVDMAISDFQTRPLSPEVVLVTYCVAAGSAGERPPRRSLRSSIWKLVDGRWQMVFHQGTPISTR